MYHLQTHNPLLPVDWRYRRACTLLESGSRLSRKRDDEWTEQMLQFLRDLQRCRDDADRQRLACRMPAFHDAHAVYSISPPQIRWAVEARLLAGESFEGIAQKCSLTPAAVECYEALFFDVLDKREAVDFIACQVIGRKLHLGLGEENIGVLWKFVGYFGGAELLDVLISGAGDEVAVQKLNSFFARDTQATVLRKLAVAARALPVNDETAVKVLDLFGHFLTADTNDAASGSITANLPDILAEVIQPHRAASEQGLAVPAVLGPLAGPPLVDEEVIPIEPDLSEDLRVGILMPKPEPLVA